MADQQYEMLVFGAQYGDVEEAINDFVAIKALHHEKWIGSYESALFEKTEDGKTRIINTDSSVRAWGATAGLVVGGVLGVIFPPSVLVMGAAGAGVGALAGHFAGGIKRSAIKELADGLQDGQAGIVLIGEFTPDEGIEKLLKRAAKITKAQIDETADELKKAVDEAAKA
ncbi:MAG: DUF1269 domain-containing protein [Coriobacteriia bacterium]|nr:DUF1269 domain-containing protein [Coriobacteriia bacterium]